MNKLFITISFLCFTSFNSYSQTFNQQSFKFDGACNLENAVNTVDENGNKVTVYQCVNQASSVSIYRINVIAFKATITDIEEYYRNLKKEYSNLGTSISTTLKGKKAIQVVEDVVVQGHDMKQISVSTLHRNKAITLVLVTSSASYETLLLDFKNQFSFL